MMRPCELCGSDFASPRASARYCGTPCRQKAHRRRRRVAAAVAAAAAAERSPLVASVRERLEDAGVLETFEGQLALVIARKLSGDRAAGAAALSKELSRCMLGALARAAATAPPEPSAEPEDEVEKARRKRDAARRAFEDRGQS